MSNSFNSGTATKIRNLLETIAQITGKEIDLSHSAGFKCTLDSPDGKALNLRIVPADQGYVTQKDGQPAADLVIPSGGGADLDGVTGTTTLVGSTKDVTIAGGVPADAIIYATHTTPAGVAKRLTAVRKDADEITIASAGDGYGALLDSAGVDGALTAGVNAAIALANAAGDLLAVKLKTLGGVAAASFAVVRVDNTSVKVLAQKADGSLEDGCTATVTVYNFGQKGHDTSLVRYAVIRP